ncbi:hypothetical protein PAMP_015098 [Pampus punctatissimus]
MGLQHKMTYSQASKKWENMKKRYKELKSPPDGVKVFPKSWPHFTLMDDAMEGRLEGKAPILKAFSNDKDNSDFLPISKLKKRRVFTVTSSPTTLVAGGSEIEVSLNGNREVGKETLQDGSLEIGRIMQEVEDERNMMDSERQVMEREKWVMERERLVLERERMVLDREVAALDRDRALVERERAMIEKEKAAMERERAMVEKDRDNLSRDRLALEREKTRLGRLSASKERLEEITKDSDIVDRKERFLNLFEKLIETF